MEQIAPVPDSSEAGSDQNPQEQALVDTPDSIGEEVEVEADADTVEAEMPGAS